jgi:hypothetical protein
VRAAGYGAIFEFPIAPSNVLQMITAISEEAGEGLSQQSGKMAGFSCHVDSIARTHEIFGLISVSAVCKENSVENDDSPVCQSRVGGSRKRSRHTLTIGH